jgi:hypothetical protein
MEKEGMPAERVVKISKDGEMRFLDWGGKGYCIVPFGDMVAEVETTIKESPFAYSIIWEQDENGFRGSALVYPKEKQDGGKWLDFKEMEAFASGLAASHGREMKRVSEANVFFGHYGFDLSSSLARHGPDTYPERMRRRLSGEVFLS